MMSVGLRQFLRLVVYIGRRRCPDFLQKRDIVLTGVRNGVDSGRDLPRVCRNVNAW